MIEASLERAGALLSGASLSGSSTGKCRAAAIQARCERLFDPIHTARLRVLLGLVAMTGLAALGLVLT